MINLSIITPTYNRPLFLENCIQHVLDLKKQGICCEHIIVDSSENDISKKICKKYDVKYIWIDPTSDALTCLSWKIYVGLSEAIGQYSMYLGDDDYLIKDKLEQQLEFLQFNTNTLFSISMDYLE